MQLSLIGKIGLDGRGFRAGLKEAELDVKRFAGNLRTQLASVFTAATASAIAQQATRVIVEHAGRIKDLGEQHRATAVEVQQLDLAMAGQGRRFEDLATNLERLAESRQKAGEGDTAMALKLDKLGVSMAEIQNPALRTIDLFNEIAATVAKMGNTNTAEADLADVLGKTGPRLISVMKDLEAVRDASGAWIVTQAEIDNIDRVSKQMDQLVLMAKSKGASLLSDLIENPLSTLFKLSLPGGLQGRFLPSTPPGGGESPAAGAVQDGPLFQDKRVGALLKEQASLYERIDKIQRGMMPAEERRLQIEEAIAMHLRNAAIVSEGGDIEGKQIALQELQKATALAGELSPEARPMTTGISPPGGFAAFGGGGNFYGGGFGIRQGADHGPRIINVLEQIKAGIDQLRAVQAPTLPERSAYE